MKQFDRILSICLVLMFPHLLQAQYATKVFDFLPAPGQFTNTSIGIRSASTNVVGNTSSMVSLGSFGGTIIVGFDQPIVNDPQNPYGVDFSIEGNSFGGNLYGQWCEPGAVQVMKDLNHNGLPDDGEWYELAGSDYWLSTTRRNVTTTYYNPHYSKGHAVTWKCDNGDYGAMVSNRFHTQPYYPDPFDFGTTIMDSVSFTGSRIRGIIDMSSPSYLNPYRAPVFGYCDSKGNNSPLTSPQNPYTSGTDGFDLSWAVDKEGNYIDLDTVNFVKIYNAGFANIGWLGEWSTEVLSVAITTPDPTYVSQDYFRNYIGITQLQVIKNQSCHYDGILFKNGRPQTDGTPRWWTSNPDVATVDTDGNLTGVELGETWLYFSQKDDIKPDSAFVKIVELTGVVLEMEGNNPNISSDTTSLLVGEKNFIIGECTDSRTNVLNATVANRFVYEPLVWTTSNPVIGTIDNGLFTGIAPGISYVYARSTSNPALYDSIKVIVRARPNVEPISKYIKIPSFSPTGTYAASDLFTTGTNAEIILDSAVAKQGNMGSSIVKNVFNYSFTSGVYTTDTVHFVLTVFGQTHNFDIVFDYNPAVKATAKQLVFTYTGSDGAKALKAWYPDSDELNTITELTDETVADMQVDGAFLYVATDKRLLRYNLSTYRAENILSLDYTAHRLVVYENRLYVSATQNGIAKLFAYFKSDLSPVTTITLPAEATALAATDSKLYALLNNASSSALSVITTDVNTVSLDKTIDWGTDGLNASDLFSKDTMLYAVRRKSTSTTSAVLSYHTTTEARTVTELPTVEYLSSNTSAAIEQMTGDSILLKNKRGFTPFNTKTLVLGATTYMRDNSRYPSGAAYDNMEKKYYVTHVGSTDSKGSVFTSAFAIDKNFTGTGIAPELVRFCPALTVNEMPAIKAAIGSQAIVENKTKLVVTVNKANSFSDTENNFSIYPKTTDTLISWARSGVNLVYTAYFDGTVTADSVVTAQVEAIDQYGCPITNAFSITIKPRIYAPYTSTVITDQQVSVNATDLQFSLQDVFEFFSANVEAQNIKTVTGNSNPTLVTATIDPTKDSLTLSFAKDQSGEALITLRGTTVETELTDGETAQSKHIEFSFKVTVVDPGTAVLPVSTAQIRVYPTLTRGKITVELNQEQTVSLFTILGTKVNSIQGKQGFNEIDLSTCPNGIYLVKSATRAVKIVLCK